MVVREWKAGYNKASSSTEDYRTVELAAMCGGGVGRRYISGHGTTMRVEAVAKSTVLMSEAARPDTWFRVDG